MAVVGVTTYRQRSSWGPWDRDAAVLPASYLDCVAAVGARPVLLPPGGAPSADPRAATDVVEALDALVLVGGGDVDPRRYGRSPHPATAGVSAGRDESESLLLAAALRADLPVLAICRGMQLLAVERGGSLHQHLPDVVGAATHQPAPGCFAPVRVTLEPGSLVAKAMGEVATVRCSHHQAVDVAGDGLVVTARAADGVVEAVELSGARFVVGVQWHPEEDADLRLFRALVEAR